ncbi:hypothetical protein IFM47457_02689 [Aspergillus lentulus]|nr:hypothetical protein IFM47457_02689 [Aspergillus lentulus]
MEERQDAGQTQLTRKRANSRTQSQDDNDGTQDPNREFHNDQCSLFALIWGRRVNVKHESGCGRPDIFFFFSTSPLFVASLPKKREKKRKQKAKAEEDDGGGTDSLIA